MTENDPSCFVEGVNMITGDFCIYDDFLTVQGAEPIQFRSTYMTKGLFLTGHEHLIATFVLFSNAIELMEPNGTSVSYLDREHRHGPIGKGFYGHPEKKKHWKSFTYRNSEFHQNSQGVSNTASGRISGQTHLKNQRIVFNPEIDPEGRSFQLYASDGTVRRYEGLKNQEKVKVPCSGIFKDDEEYLVYRYKLVSEHLPNGHVVRYNWGKDNKLYDIRTTDLSGKKIFAQVRLPQISKDNPQSKLSMTGSDGKTMTSHYQPSSLKKQWVYASVIPPEQPNRSYHWTSRKRKAEKGTIDFPYLSSLSQPNGRTLHLHYDGGDKDGIPRVSSLSSPAGKEASPLVTHQFFYGKQSSYVLDIDGNKTNYEWNNEERLVAISKFIGSDTLHSKEHFVWNGTFLVCKSFFNEHKECLHARTLAYDDWGNVIKNTLHGNLSGQGPSPELDEKKIPLPGCESCSTNSVFSQDGKNLPLRIEDPNGLVVLFSYLPDTNLIKTKTLCEGETAKIFHTYEYDEDFLLISEEINDGVMKTIKRISPKQTDPYIGMPEVIEEKYLDGGREILLKKTILHYRKGGLIEHKDVYDANEVFQYRLSYEYDEKNRIISETNPIGQKTKASYDPLGNRCFYQDMSGRFEQTSVYDCANRLTKNTWTGDGVTLTKENSYDTKHHLEWESDERGHKTYYKYNLLGQKIETTLPAIRTETGELITPIIRQEYDASGHEILRIDAEGHRTETKYNVYGKPIHIIHPNDLEERFIYTLSGDLICHIDTANIETHYEYDYLRHIISKATYAKGQQLARETNRYIGHHLVSTTDAEGNETMYSYDKAGRKISETCGEETSFYEYDALGRVFRIRQGGEITTKTFDLLDRVIQEEQTSLSGELLKKIRYGYDSAGNKNSTTFFVADGTSQETCLYDALNRIIEKTNADGFQERISYEDVLNEEGQKVLQKTHTDSLRLQTIETFDTHGRLSKIEKRKSKTLSLTHKFYTPRGLLALQVDTIFSPNGTSRESRIRWEYDTMGRNIKLIEAGGTPDAKITHKAYTPRGELAKLTKPDGSEVFYTYNDLNQLVLIHSSDGTVHHEMSYNRLGHLQTSDGLIRKTDAKGRVLSETFPLGHSIQNTFDSLGRKTSCQLPEANCLIEYSYEGRNLSSISRKTMDGQEIYSHRYLKRDLSRHLLEESLIGNLGLIKHTFDRMSRRVETQAPHFSQQILEFDPVGNILSMRLQQEILNYTYDDLYQLIEETGLFAHHSTYDSMKNRLSKDEENYEVNALNQLISHLSYNTNGCPTSLGTTKFIYDALDRLIAIITPNMVQRFGYDCLHRCLFKRTVRSNTQQTLYFLYDGQKEIGSFDPSLAIQELRILGATPEAERGAAIAVELKEKIFAPLHDLQGNLTALIPLDGTKPSFYRFSAFGEEKIYGYTLSPWRFSSKRSDAETNLVYYGRRFYMPLLGRWLTPDPAGFTDGMNLYNFLQNQPLIHFDEYGLWLQPRPPGTFNSSNIRQNWNYQMNQFSTGFNQGVLNAGFGLARLANTMTHGMNAIDPFRAYNWKDGSFHFSMGDSYHSLNNWLKQKQSIINNQLFPGGNSDRLAFKLGHFAGNFLGDTAMFGGVFRLSQNGIANSNKLLNLNKIEFNFANAPQNNTQILFGQKSVSPFFSEIGTFKSKPLSEVMRGLRNGTISPESIPIEIIIRNGQKITLNNRSLLTLKRAGMEPTTIFDRTGIESYELILNSHLRNSLPSDVIKIRGGPPGTSFIGPLE